MTRIGALSRASNVADNTTSRRMRIIQKNIPVEDFMVGNWDKRKYKFRPFKIRQGRKYKLPSTFIEKTSYAIDTRGEKRGLRAKNYTQSRGWLIPKRKKGKKKRGYQWLV